MSLSRLFGRKKKRVDDDPRIYVTKDISPEAFVAVNDQSYMYRQRVLPEAFTLEFWKKTGLVDFLLNSGVLKSEILDVGCGSGEIDIIIAGKGYTITAVDISPYAIELAKKHAEKVPECDGRVQFLVGDIETIDFKKKFSTAIVSHTLEHVLSPENTFQNIIRSLEPNSHILVSVPHKKSWRDRTHLRQFSERSLRQFLSRYSNELRVWANKPEKMLYAIMKV